MAIESDVDWLENRCGFAVPAELRSFLILETSINGKLFRIEDGESQIRETLSIAGQETSSLFTVWCSNTDAPFAAKKIPIAWDIGDNLLVAADNGNVFWVDHESLTESKVADTFLDFLEGLYDEQARSIEKIEQLARSGPTHAIKSFLEEFPNARSIHGRSLAQEAARHGNVEALQICFNHSMDLSGCIHLAAMNDHAAAVRFLVNEAGVDLNERNQNGWTPLQCVLLNEDLKDWLVGKGAA